MLMLFGFIEAIVYIVMVLTKTGIYFPFADGSGHSRTTNEYYRALAEADERADARPFVEFMLQSLLDAIRESGDTDQVMGYAQRPLQALTINSIYL